MPTTTIDVGARGDDADFIGTTAWRDMFSYAAFGSENNGPYDWAAQFDSVGVGQGDTITSATLRLDVVSTFEGAPPTTNFGALYGEDADNATTLGTGSGSPKGMTATTASGEWFTDMPASGGGTYTFDVASIIQEIVDRTGWASGNNINLLAVTTGDFGNAFNIIRIGQFSGYPGPGPNTVPRLTVVYTTGGATAVKDVIGGTGIVPSAR